MPQFLDHLTQMVIQSECAVCGTMAAALFLGRTLDQSSLKFLENDSQSQKWTLSKLGSLS